MTIPPVKPVYGVLDFKGQVVLPPGPQPPAPPVEGSMYASGGLVYIWSDEAWVEVAESAVAAHEAAADPHPGYLTQSEADALYTAAGVTSGSLILSGTATPAAGTGATGDYYLDTDDNILYGPKALIPPFGTDQYVTMSDMTGVATMGATIGMTHTFARSGQVTGVRVYLPATATNTSGFEVYLFDKIGDVLLASKDALALTKGAWNTVLFTTPVPVVSAQVYMVAYWNPGGANDVAKSTASYGGYPGETTGDVHVLASGEDGPQGKYDGARDTYPHSATVAVGVTPVFQASSGSVSPWPVALKSVPPGGTTSQVLAKTAATDYAAAWVAAPAGLQTRATATKTTASLAHTASETGTISLANGYRLYSITCSAPCRVRLYTTAAKRDADTARAIGVDPSGDHGLQFEFVATNPDLAFDLTPLVDGFDGKATPDGAIPITITNMSGAAAAITVQLLHLRTE